MGKRKGAGRNKEEKHIVCSLRTIVLRWDANTAAIGSSC